MSRWFPSTREALARAISRIQTLRARSSTDAAAPILARSPSWNRTQRGPACANAASSVRFLVLASLTMRSRLPRMKYRCRAERNADALWGETKHE
jgi:hypothetical protein